jgi:hypothetical protein
MISKKDILLVLIDLPVDNTKLISPIQIMKSLFLLKEETKLKDFYEFVPYLYGPCSFEVYSDLISLKEETLIEDVPTFSSWKYYKTTSIGSEKASLVMKTLDEELLKELIRIKKFVVTKTFLELLSYIYKKYPEYAKNSIINLKGLK